MTIRVLLVDDEELVRFGLRTVLEAAGDFEVVGEAGDGEAAVAAAHELRPDVVLIDIRMPVLDGLSATRRILALPHPPQVPVLTTFHVDEYVYAALAAGAAGFLLKDTPPREIAAAVRAVADGTATLSPAVTRNLIDSYVDRAATPRRTAARERLADLSEREREVLRLVGRGESNAAIGKELFVSEATVKTYVSRLLASWSWPTARRPRSWRTRPACSRAEPFGPGRCRKALLACPHDRDVRAEHGRAATVSRYGHRRAQGVRRACRHSPGQALRPPRPRSQRRWAAGLDRGVHRRSAPRWQRGEMIVPGSAYLDVVLLGIDWTDPNVPEYDGHPIDQHWPALRGVRWDGSFEGQTHAVIGLTGRLPFRVGNLNNPERVFVDIAYA